MRTIVDDANFYDQLKLLARFVRLAGYDGLLVCLDEMVNLYKLANTQARNANYEQILRILNDSLQGTAAGLGFLFGGTPEFLMDTRRGLYSYAALQSRLAENTLRRRRARRLLAARCCGWPNLTPGGLLRAADASCATSTPPATRPPTCCPTRRSTPSWTHCSPAIGDAYFRTPRTTIKRFLDLLAVLEQNPEQPWEQLLGAVPVDVETNPDLEPLEDAADEATPARSTRDAGPRRRATITGQHRLRQPAPTERGR